jgi:hypothetical protein
MTKNFKKLVNFFGTILSSSSKTIDVYSEAELEIISQAQILLDAKLYEKYFILVKNGYRIPEVQQKQISKAFIEDLEGDLQSGLCYLFDKPDYPPKLNTFLSYGYEPNEKDIFFILTNEVYHIYNENCLTLSQKQLSQLKQQYTGQLLLEQIDKNLSEPMIYFKKLNDYLKNALNDKNLTEQLLSHWQQSLFTHLDKYDSDSSKEKNFNLCFDIMIDKWIQNGNVNAQKLIDLEEQLNKKLVKFKKRKAISYFDEQDIEKAVNIVEKIQLSIKLLQQPDFNHLLDKTKQVYGNQAFEIKKDNLNQYNESIKILPKEVLDKVIAIKDSCFELEKHKESLNLEQQVALKNVVEKSLPTILEQYFNIPKQFRDKALKDEKTPLDYVNNSLDNLIDYLSTFHQAVAETYVQKLAVSEKYTKKLTLNN